jgi:hypothetical protein
MLSLEKYDESGLIEDVSQRYVPTGINSIQLPPFDNVKLNFKLNNK